MLRTDEFLPRRRRDAENTQDITAKDAKNTKKASLAKARKRKKNISHEDH